MGNLSWKSAGSGFESLAAHKSAGQNSDLRLRLAPLLQIDSWLEPYRDLWRGRLDALEAHLDRMD